MENFIWLTSITMEKVAVQLDLKCWKGWSPASTILGILDTNVPFLKTYNCRSNTTVGSPKTTCSSILEEWRCVHFSNSKLLRFDRCLSLIFFGRKSWWGHLQSRSDLECGFRESVCIHRRCIEEGYRRKQTKERVLAIAECTWFWCISLLSTVEVSHRWFLGALRSISM